MRRRLQGGDRGAVISILWEKSSAIKTWTHGYVGGRRYFTIEQAPQMPILLISHLPGPHGTQSPIQCLTLNDAQVRANGELAEFFKQLSELVNS